MSTSTLEMIETNKNAEINDIAHLYCGECYPYDPDCTHAMCGHEFESEWADDSAIEDDECVVCVDLFETHCYREHGE